MIPGTPAGRARQSVSEKATDEQILAALKTCNGVRTLAAQSVGLSLRPFMARVAKLKLRGHDIPRSSYDPATSTLYGADGTLRLQWVKRPAKEVTPEVISDAIRNALLDVPRAKPTAAPKLAPQDLCNLYTLTDCHVGMLAWKRETGADWDLAIAEDLITKTFLQLIQSSPAAATGIVNQLGDFMHFDSLVPETPTNRNVLDADSRFQKVVEAAVRILRRIIDAALKKHAKVYVFMHEGNHDPAGSVWLRAVFSTLYENEPRIVVNTSPQPYIAHQHGKTMIGFHHGHLSKNQSLPLLFAAKFDEMWGVTRKRYIHVGHRHHVDEREHPGVKVIQHPTLAAPDAYAARGGWLSERQATAITYHADFGECGRGTIVPEMISGHV